MSVHSVEDLADAVRAEEEAIAATKSELREGPSCVDGCNCQCMKTHCGCHDEELLSWRSREQGRFEVPMSPEVAEAAGRG